METTEIQRLKYKKKSRRCRGTEPCFLGGRARSPVALFGRRPCQPQRKSFPRGRIVGRWNPRKGFRLFSRRIRQGLAQKLRNSGDNSFDADASHTTQVYGTLTAKAGRAGRAAHQQPMARVA